MSDPQIEADLKAVEDAASDLTMPCSTEGYQECISILASRAPVIVKRYRALLDLHDRDMEAERLLEAAKADVRAADPEAPKAWSVALDRASIALRAAEVHARLAALDDDWRSGYHVPASPLRMLSADELAQLSPGEWGRPVEDVTLP